MSHRRHPSLSEATGLVSLAAVVLLFFWKIALTNGVLAGLDVFAYFYPYRDYAAEALRAGRLPLWNPHLFMGAPFLANSQAAVLYPLHWPLLWLSTPKQIAWSIELHIFLAAAGTYLLARRSLGLRVLPAWVAAALFGLGGFLGAQVEHINQLNASAWLPWLLLCVDGARARQSRSRLWMLLGSLVVALILLAGHTQAAYIVMLAAGAYGLLRGLDDAAGPGSRRAWLRAIRPLTLLGAMALFGAILAAAQLAPTWELSQLSVRRGGLPYREAVSFSLRPGLVPKAFLPPLLWEPPLSEYVAYVGLSGLALAAVGAGSLLHRSQRPRRGTWLAWLSRPATAALVLALLGVFLALGGYNPFYYLLYKAVPGFALFRAPARWLLLYAFGAALLGGVGLEHLGRRRSWSAVAVGALLVLELLVARTRLAYNNPTAPAAYDSMRTAPAHLLAESSSGPSRFLSLSDIEYDPGDLADLRALYGGRLSQRALYDLVVAAKMKEVLAYNLPLGYRLDSVDGYDGGLLPTRQYVAFERLFLAEEEIWPDGRLRQQLPGIPRTPLLSLLNVKHVITDKLQDAWVDDIYYDLEHSAALGAVELCELPDFEATDLGVVSYLTGAAEIADGTAVASVTLTGGDVPIELLLRAGSDTSEGSYTETAVSHRQARVAHAWRDGRPGSDYLSVLDLGTIQSLDCIRVRSLLPAGQVVLRGLSLIDRRTGTSRSLSIDPDYRLAHSGDVKIYENLVVGPRAFFAGRARPVRSDEEALAVLGSPDFDPRREVLLSDIEAPTGDGGSAEVHLVRYEPERVEIQVVSEGAGYLVLVDSFYPGWLAEVDGESAPIHRADLYFRAVEIEGGHHSIVFHFRPKSVQVGLVLSALGLVLCSVGLAIALRSPLDKKRPMGYNREL